MPLLTQVAVVSASALFVRGVPRGEERTTARGVSRVPSRGDRGDVVVGQVGVACSSIYTEQKSSHVVNLSLASWARWVRSAKSRYRV